MLFSLRIRSRAGFVLLLILNLVISVSSSAHSIYGPGGARGESYGGQGAAFGPDGCGYLSNAGAGGYPSSAYCMGGTCQQQPLPQPSRIQPTANTNSPTPTDVKNQPAAASTASEPAKSTATGGTSGSEDKSAAKDKAKTTQVSKTDLVAAGKSAMGKCIACHKKDESKELNAPQTEPGSRPSHMPPKDSMTADEIKAVDEYLKSKSST